MEVCFFTVILKSLFFPSLSLYICICIEYIQLKLNNLIEYRTGK